MFTSVVILFIMEAARKGDKMLEPYEGKLSRTVLRRGRGSNSSDLADYRYYSILQYEKLGTIMELRQLNMSIDEIKRYFDNRNLNQSVEMLKEKHSELKEKIRRLQQLEESIEEKIEHLEYISEFADSNETVIRDIGERDIITFNRCAENEIDLSYACLELENGLEEISPLLGSNRIGAIVNYRDIELDECVESMVLFFFVKDRENIDENLIKKIPKCMYACRHYKGSLWNTKGHMRRMMEYIQERGYYACGDILQIVQIDISVTDQNDEVMFETQIPIKKH